MNRGSSRRKCFLLSGCLVLWLAPAHQRHHRLRHALAELNAHIQDVFNEHGVQIMSPHYANDPEGGAKIVPKEQ